ncbi:MAG: hypothetical protein E3J72_11770 [Planctomycetota bacterium]|nr:MAG: hypothetical protein E3J72_11770 [Planctomycetota bacterium]
MYRYIIAFITIVILAVSAGCASPPEVSKEDRILRGDYPGIPIEPEIREAAMIRGKAMTHFQMAMRVRKRVNSIMHFKEATKLFEQAMRIYFDAMRKYPDYQKHFVQHEIDTVDKYIIRCLRFCPAGFNPLEEIYVKTGPLRGLTPEERDEKSDLEAKVAAAEANR